MHNVSDGTFKCICTGYITNVKLNLEGERWPRNLGIVGPNPTGVTTMKVI